MMKHIEIDTARARRVLAREKVSYAVHDVLGPLGEMFFRANDGTWDEQVHVILRHNHNGTCVASSLTEFGTLAIDAMKE
jgi:hypothetical protein